MNPGLRWQAARELVQRYARVFGHAWAGRREMEPPPRLAHELQFLPAALSLQETPVHPAPRWAMVLILCFGLIALVWAVIGRVDIVATAAGKIIPNDRTKVIQPLETAVVKALHVREGQLVAAGELLIELDPTTAAADAERIAIELKDARYAEARASAMLAAMVAGASQAMLSLVEGEEQERHLIEQRLLEGEYNEYLAKLDQIDAAIAGRDAEREATRELLLKLTQTMPIVQQRSADYRRLLEKNYVARHDYLQLEQQRIEMEGDFAAQKARLEEIEAALQEAKMQRQAVMAETRRQQLDEQHEAKQRAVALRQELIKAKQRRRLTRLVAPVDGVVQQLTAHTIGGVVREAEPILVIVPRENLLEVEAKVLNKDIGFVDVGDEAQIKIETFPFTKYGTIRGEVLHVSNDAVQDEKQGLVYTARVRLERHTLQVEQKLVQLTPGMAVTVEVKTGKRRLIEYFLSPLLQYKEESLRER